MVSKIFPLTYKTSRHRKQLKSNKRLAIKKGLSTKDAMRDATRSDLALY